MSKDWFKTAKTNYQTILDDEVKKDDRATTEKMDEWIKKNQEAYDKIKAHSNKGVHAFVKFLWETYPPQRKNFDPKVEMENYDSKYKKKLLIKSFTYYHPDKAEDEHKTRNEVITRFLTPIYECMK